MTVQKTAAESHKIKRNVSLFDGICLVIGLVIGTGIYLVPALVAQSLPNEFSLYMLWLIGGALSICGALCYAELGSTYPEQGGDYFFLKRSFGSLVSFLYAWAQIILVRPGSIAAVSFPLAVYTQAALPSVFGEMSQTLIAASYVALISGFNLLGSSSGRVTQNILSCLSYLLLAFIVVCGLFSGARGDVGLLPQPATIQYGLALVLILFCYGGWSELALLGGEVKNPGKTFLPALIIGICLVTILYCVVNYAYINVLGFSGLKATETPAKYMHRMFDERFISSLIVCCCLSSLNGLILSGSRIFYVFGRDHLNVLQMGTWHQDKNSPHNALFVQGALGVLLVFLAGSFSAALVYTTTIVWLFYFAVGISLFVLRYKDAGRDRPYSTWGYPVTPLVFCGSCVFVMQSAMRYDFQGSLITLLIVFAGVPIHYWLQGRKSGH